jgi:magnesium transporter
MSRRQNRGQNLASHTVFMIVDCALYADGVRAESVEDLAGTVKRARDLPDGFVWIGLFEPSQGELEHIAAQFGLHPLAVEDAVEAHQRPKLEVYGDNLLVVLKPLQYDETASRVRAGELLLFLGNAYVVTVRHGHANPLSEVRRRLESSPDMLRCGPSSVLYAVCDAVVDNYGGLIVRVNEDLEELESQVFSPERTNDAMAIYALKRKVLEFRHAALPLAEPTHALAERDMAFVHDDMRPFFRDVSDHLYRVNDQVEAFDKLLTDILTANLTQVGLRQNEDMRRISAWLAIAALPTVVAGIYGMNFDNMPELRWQYGYFMVLGVLASLCTGLYVAFKRSGWL